MVNMSIARLFSKNFLFSLALIAAVLKTGSLVLFYFLPKKSVEYYPEIVVSLPYNTYKYSSIMDLDIKREQVVAKPKPKPKPKPTLYKITNLILKGVYAEEGKGFIFVAEKAKPEENKLISVGEDFQGYRLVEVLPREAIFENAGKRYSLSMDDTKSPVEKMVETQEIDKKIEEANKAEDVIRALPRKEIDYYTSDLKKIWSNIKIKEMRSGDKIDGFKIVAIRRNSIFYQLGLQPNDIIIKVNNKPLKNYADALNAYRSVKKNTALKMTILRNGKEKELEYEIF